MGKQHGTLAKAGKVQYVISGQKTNPQGWQARESQEDPRRKSPEETKIQQKICQYGGRCRWR